MRADPFLLDRECVCTGSRLQVLLAVTLLGEVQPVVTVTDVGTRTGLGRAAVHWHLVRLRDAGLVEWETGRRGTLRASVARVPFGV